MRPTRRHRRSVRPDRRRDGPARWSGPRRGIDVAQARRAILDAEFDEVLDVNLRSAFYALRAFVRAVPRAAGDLIVLFSTAATRIGLMNHEVISAAKGGVDGLVAAASAMYGAPGDPRRTPGHRTRAFEPDPPPHRQLSRPCGHRRRCTPGRVGHPGDVAGLAAFLTDGRRTVWITGQVIAVDGGLSGVKLPPAAGNHMRSVSR